QLRRRNDEAASLHNLGSVYTELGFFDEALDLLQEALAIRSGGGRPELIAGTLVEIGWAYHLAGHPEQAIGHFRKAIGLYRSIGQSSGEAAALDRLGSALRRTGRPGLALDAYRRSLALSEQTRDRRSVAHTRANLGWLLVEQGQRAAGTRALELALESFQRLEEPEGRAHALVGLATAARISGDLKTARRRFQEALSLVEQQRAYGRRQGYWIQAVALWDDYYESYVDLLVELSRTGQAGALASAFEVSDWARSRNLYDMLLESQVDLRVGIDPRLRALEADVQERLNAVEDRRRAVLLSSSRHNPEAAALQRSLRSLRQQFQQVEAKIRAANPRLAAISHPKPVALREAQRLLDPGTRLISYVLGEKRSFVFVVGPNSLDCLDLPPRAQIEAMAREAYEGLVHGGNKRSRMETGEVAASLESMLLGKIDLTSEVKRLLVVPEGRLLYIPFAALPSRAGELLDRFEIVQIPSAATLVALRHRERLRPQPRKRLAIVADPVLSPNDYRLEKFRTVVRSEPLDPLTAFLSPLPFSRREANAIESQVPPEGRLVALGLSANRDLLLSGALADYRVLHFATHAVIDEQNPELSGLVLSAFDSSGRRCPAYLRLHEIFNLDLPADLVVLSACRTALGKRVRGDGITGLTQGFLNSGASRLVVTLWDAEDEATAALMSRFY
ncbi:MAG TPA: CHAT domain-containing protein, partial [Gemmatimonadales bacterium]|nr:CHAT domain-containing protein [Gemmatimonadales bacterium]